MKTLCVVSHSPSVSEKIGTQLAEVLRERVRVVTWSMDKEPLPPAGVIDLFLTTFPSVHEEALVRLCQKAPEGPLPRVLMAERILSPVHFDKLLAVPSGTQALIAGNSYLACSVLLSNLQDYGVRHLETFFHYPDHLVSESSNIHLAIVTGVNKLVPSWIDTIIDIGVKELALTTYYEIFKILDVPFSILNKIVKGYTTPIFEVTKRYHEESQKVHALLHCVDDAVFTIDSNGYVDIWNSAASSFAKRDIERNKTHICQIFPDIKLRFPLEPGCVVMDSLMQLQGKDCVVRLEPLGGGTSGSVLLIREVRQIQELEGMTRRALRRKGSISRYRFDDILTASMLMKEHIELARRFAHTDATILLEGESGVGKELFAHAIHQASERASGPFVAINLAAMPEHLAESELFGYVEGSFTGARKGGQRGLFEEAHQGTIFLDEIGDAPLPLQIKLLRVLEEREIRKIGSGTAIPVDVRVVAATNRPLDRMMRENTFRTDLFYRLCVCPVSIPALRERGNDVLMLVSHFVRQSGRTLHMNAELEVFFKQYTWPGNVRELQNVVKYILGSVVDGTEVHLRHLPNYLRRGQHLSKTANDAHEMATTPRQEWPETTLPAHQNATQVPPSPSESTDPARLVASRSRTENPEVHVSKNAELSPAQLALLDILDQATEPLGRQALLNRLRQMLPNASMYAVRQTLHELEARGLVLVGITRQGCRISPQGRQVRQVARPCL